MKKLMYLVEYRDFNKKIHKEIFEKEPVKGYLECILKNYNEVKIQRTKFEIGE